MSKKIEFSLSSLVDLKAELYKKRQDFAQKKAQNAQSINSEGFLNSVKKTIFDSSKSKKQQDVAHSLRLDNEEEKKLDQSRKKLIEKAAIYDKLSSGNSVDGLVDDEGKSLCLVDFDRKKQHCVDSDSDSNAKESEPNMCQVEPSCSRETRRKNVSDDDGVCSEDEFVEFVDSFGRTRRCMRKDLHKFKESDKKSSGNRIALLKQDNPKNESRQNKPAADSSIQEPNFVHYQHVSKDEIWDRGAGYYQFSSDEVERQQQMKRLNELRQQTREKRHSVEQLKEKRKKIMAQRLEKVKERKKLNIDLDEIEPKEHDDDIDLDDIQLPGEAEIEAKRVRIEREASRAEHIRPWDVGKSKKTHTVNDWIQNQREERYSEFAPPSSYFRK